MAKVTYSQSLEAYVLGGDDYIPLIGVFSQSELVEGWKWDKTVLSSESIPSSRYATTLVSNRYLHIEGIPKEDFVCGISEGIEVIKTLPVSISGQSLWLPVVSTGIYNLWDEQRKLYSDYSLSVNADLDSLSSGNYLWTLPESSLLSTVSISLFKREEDMMIVSYRNWEEVSEDDFDAAIALTPDDRSNIFWIDYDNAEVETVGAFYIDVATSDTTLSYVTDLWESHGTGYENCNVFTKYFPLQNDSVRVAEVVAGVPTLWTEVSSFADSGPTDKHFKVNYDIGVIEFGGKIQNSLFLANAINSSTTEILALFDRDTLDSWPNQGVILIDSEEIFYEELNDLGFFGCTRGYNSTSPASHSAGDIVELIQQGQAPTGELYVSYKAVPRLTVELSEGYRTANRNNPLTTNPTGVVEPRGVLQIVSSTPNLAEVYLEIDRPLIASNVYGPAYYGIDVSRLTARALDARGIPVENVDLTIEIVSGGGSLNDGLLEYSSTSNSLGEIYTHYNIPYTEAEYMSEVISVSHSGSDTEMELSSLPSVATASEIWVYQTLKHDAITGTVGFKSVVYDAKGPFLGNTIDVEAVYGEELKGGKIIVLNTSGVRVTYTIERSQAFLDGTTGERRVRLWIVEPLTPPTLIGQPSRIFTREDVEWNPSIKNGVKLILYEWSTDYKHPLTAATGAYGPVRPNSVENNILTFTGRNLPIPDPNDEDNNLGGYVVIAPSEVKFRAYGRDPYSGNLIYSNEIRLLIKVGSMLQGVDSSGILPVPHGWKLATDTYNIGSAIGGANFFTVNPRATGLNQFSIHGAI